MECMEGVTGGRGCARIEKLKIGKVKNRKIGKRMAAKGHKDAEARGQNPEARSQKTEARGRKPEDGSRRTGGGGRNRSGGCWRPERWGVGFPGYSRVFPAGGAVSRIFVGVNFFLRPEARGQKPEDRSQKPEAGGQKPGARGRKRRPEAVGR